MWNAIRISFRPRNSVSYIHVGLKTRRVQDVPDMPLFASP